MPKLMDAALSYLRRDWSVIPVGPDKRPLIAWEFYQHRKALETDLCQWAKLNPSGIALVTGRISGVCAVDLDKYNSAYNEMTVIEVLPDGIETPTSRTPRGGNHLLFAMPEGEIRSRNGLMPGVDLKAEGGYVILPPSRNGAGVYEWIISPEEIAPAAFPPSLYKYINLYKSSVDTVPRVSTMSTNVHKMFEYGRRDEDLFHTANCLVKGGMPTAEVIQVLEKLIISWGEELDEKWVQAKVESALKRAERRERNITAEIREWVASTTGHFESTNIHACLQLSTREERKAVSMALSRMVEEGIIERYGIKNGCFRRKETELELLDWRNAPTGEFDIDLPLDLSRHVKIYPRNLIVFAGAKSSGKTAMALDIVKRNMNKYSVVYMTCEVGDTELRNRIELHSDIKQEDWNFQAVTRHDNHADLITGEKKIWIIDYIEVIDEPWKAAKPIKAIHDKLREGVAIIFLQKNPGTEWGRGGAWTLDKARLYVSLDRVEGGNRAKIIDCKAFRDQNPRGWVLNYKLVSGARFIPDGYWRQDSN